MNFIVRNIILFLWATIQFTTFNIIFSHVDALAGWKKEEVILVGVVMYFTNGIFKTFFQNNILQLPKYIRMGQLDGMLLKPIRAIFLVSTRFISLAEFPSMVVFAIILVRYSFKINPSLTIPTFVLALIMIGIGAVGMFGFLFTLNTIAFWKPRLWNLSFLSSRVKSLASFPSDIYRGIFRGIVYFSPIAAFTTIPALFLLGKGSWQLFVYSSFVCFSFFGVAIIAWKRGLLRYESASS